jgi:hypothetical protein
MEFEPRHPRPNENSEGGPMHRIRWFAKVPEVVLITARDETYALASLTWKAC